MSAPVLYHLGGFPPPVIDWGRLVSPVGRANAALARYDGLVAAIPNASVLLSPLTTQEAVLSSKIEGTNVTMGEVLEIEAGGDGDVAQPKRDDAEEIRNYRIALSFAAKAVAERPLTPHLLREVHALLMKGVRGRDKNSAPSVTSKIGSVIPVVRSSRHPSCRYRRRSFMRASTSGRTMSPAVTSPTRLAQLAVIHAEFEALHPFKDGNGRLGRMIIPLFLFARKVLSGPNFYMSGYLEARRDQYIDVLRAISRDGAWTPWCAFFLEGLIEQASENQAKAQAILDLHHRMSRQVAELTHSQYAGRAVDFLFSRPVFASTHFVEGSHIPRQTALRFLDCLTRGGGTSHDPRRSRPSGDDPRLSGPSQYCRGKGRFLSIMDLQQATLCITKSLFMIHKLNCFASMIHKRRHRADEMHNV